MKIDFSSLEKAKTAEATEGSRDTGGEGGQGEKRVDQLSEAVGLWLAAEAKAADDEKMREGNLADKQLQQTIIG